jgi:hypothetical protein
MRVTAERSSVRTIVREHVQAGFDSSALSRVSSACFSGVSFRIP